MKKELLSGVFALTLLASPAMADGVPKLYFNGDFAAHAGLEGECMKVEGKVKEIVEYAARMEYKLEKGQITEVKPKERNLVGDVPLVDCIVDAVDKATDGQYELYKFQKFGFEAYEVRKVK